MNLTARKVLEILVMPPFSLYLAMALGLALARVGNRKWLRRTGAGLALTSGACLVLMSVPFVAHSLLDSLQVDPAIPSDQTDLDAEAIVVLAGDIDCDPAEYGQDQPGALSLMRCRYGAVLAHRTGLPMLITGGVLRPDRRPVSHVLRDFVEDELHVAVRWTEDQATTTQGNAEYSAAMLKDVGIARIALVTHAWHMPRSKRAFERAGLSVLPAPMGAHAGPSNFREGIVPRARAFQDSAWAIHEWIGRAWYWLRS